MVSAVKAVQVSSFRTRVPVLAQLLTLIIDHTVLAIYLMCDEELSMCYKERSGETFFFLAPFPLYDKIHNHDVTLWKKSDVELWVQSETL